MRPSAAARCTSEDGTCGVTKVTRGAPVAMVKKKRLSKRLTLKDRYKIKRKISFVALAHCGSANALGGRQGAQPEAEEAIKEG